LIAGTAARHGALLVDLSSDDAETDARYFGADRLHLGALGHQRVAGHLLRALDVRPDERWLAPLPPPAREPYWRIAARQWDWARNHALSAVRVTIHNRLTGRQPGDGFVPKRPQLGRLR
jgi:hypothetical protein